MNETLLAADRLGLSFGSSRILNDISFTLDEHDFISFVGPSGCGKTTLLHIITGIQPDYQGSLSVRTGKVSFVSQKESLLEWRDALSNVLLPFELSGLPADDGVRNKAMEMLEMVGLGGYAHHFPGELSGGMRKRVEIARALVTDPRLLVLDEPFSTLDIITREKLNILVKHIRSLRSTAVILVTHSVEEACFLSNRIYVMSRLPGRIIQTFEIAGKEESRSDRFQLTLSELTVDNTIREQAQFLWAEDPAPYTETPAFRSSGGAALKTAGERRYSTGDSRITVTRPHESAQPGVAVKKESGERRSRGLNRNIVLIPLELIAIFGILTWIKGAFSIPDVILPYPAAVFLRFTQTLLSGEILPDLGMTVLESLSGFAIAFAITLVLGYVIAKSGLLSRLLMPYLVAANTIPSVALAPFLVLWFGFGLTPRIVTSVIVIFFPMLINTTSAIKFASEDMRDLLRFYKPSWRQSFLKFEFPAALPMIWSGIKISITLSVIGAVVGEFVSGSLGLGALVSRGKAMFDVELMFVGMVWLIILGISYYGIVSLVYGIILKRRKTEPAARGAEFRRKDERRRKQ